MHGYLKGYYGYKNFGDELLLLGLIPWLFKQHQLTSLSIEAADPVWLRSRIERHQDMPSLQRLIPLIDIVPKHAVANVMPDLIFFGGGEVVTDGRPFPYNGRNYLLRYDSWIRARKYHLLGGIGTPKKFFSRRLRKFLLTHACSVTVREQRSFEVASTFTDPSKITLYHDFALDVLSNITSSSPVLLPNEQIVLNINPYIWSPETKQKIHHLADLHQGADRLFFPAEIGVDDRYMEELKKILPSIGVFDRTSLHLQQIIDRLSGSSFGIAARLHVLLLLRFLQIPFEPLVYQEKITTFLQTCFDESSSS